jgi:hypothetical protein
MTKTISWPARAIYIALALALVFSLAAVAVSPTKVDAYGETKWSKVSTPSLDDLVIQPGTDIIDMVASEDGMTIYAILDGELDCMCNDCMENGDCNEEDGYGDEVVKSTDGGVTWDDITDEVEEEDMDNPMTIAIAPGNSDFVFIAGWDNGDYNVIGSDDGGDDFSDMGFAGTDGGDDIVLCMAVSPEAGDAYNVAVGTDDGQIWRYKVGGTFGGSWADTTDYQGWDGDTDLILALIFSPYWDADDTIVGIVQSDMAGYDAVYQISGIWGTTKAWNAEAGSPFTSPVEIIDCAAWVADGLDGDADEWDHAAGIAMPTDFIGYDSGNRYTWVYVNYDADTSNGDVPASFADEFDGVGQVFRVKGSSVDYAGVECEPWDTSAGYPLMASIAMTGEIDDGAIMVGLQGPTDCCAGINVKRTAEWPIDLCCPQWSGASKKPTGQTNALVQYVDDGAKGYAATSSCLMAQDELDESAFSVSEVDTIGKYWNQPSLVDTCIDFLSDMAVNPSCGTIYIFAINECGCDCDSVWMSTDDGDSYLRVFNKALENDWGLIRLAPEEEDEVLTVYLVDQGTKDLWWNDDSGYTKWESRKASTLDHIYDLAVESEDTIWAVEGPADDMYGDGGNDADASMSDKHGGPGSWTSAKDTKVDVGWSIVVDPDTGHVLVGSYESGKVGFYDGDGWSKLDDIGSGAITCAFDTYYEDNDYVYAAVFNGDDGVHRTTVADGDFSDMDAPDNGGYVGVVTEISQSGNPKTSASTGGVLYALSWDGMARQLEPAKSTCCGDLSWDWLDSKLDLECEFGLDPRPLKICGCLTASSDAHLWAIDYCCYDMDGGDSSGSPWVYRDCFAKAGPTLVGVADGSTIPCGDCACGNEKFQLDWERLCNECEYQFQISLNDSFTKVVLTEQDGSFADMIGDGGFYDPPNNKAPSVVIGEGDLDANTTYYWRVKTRWSDRPETIRSWWSDVWSFTVESCGTLGLTAPDDGASNLPSRALALHGPLLMMLNTISYYHQTGICQAL